jgi:hypothetical protein
MIGGGQRKARSGNRRDDRRVVQIVSSDNLIPPSMPPTHTPLGSTRLESDERNLFRKIIPRANSFSTEKQEGTRARSSAWNIPAIRSALATPLRLRCALITSAKRA